MAIPLPGPADEGIRARTALAAFGSALWIAVVFGVVEVLILLVRREWLGSFVWAPGPIWWMTPASVVLWIAPLAAAMALAGWIVPHRVSRRAQVFIPATIAASGLLFMIPWVYPAGLVLLGVGVASTLPVWVRGGLGAVVLRPRGRVAAALLSAWGLGGLVVTTLSTPPAVAPPADASRPNIVLLILDTVRASNMSLYGYERATTPNLAALADSGVVFDRAVAPSSWTLPSHASMFTGRLPSELDADWHVPVSDDAPRLAEALAEVGYETAAFTANFFYTDREKGLAKGFRVYDDYRSTLGQVGLSSSLGQMIRAWRLAVASGGGVRAVTRRLWTTRHPSERWSDRKTAEEVNRELLTWLGKSPRRPYFAFLNYFDAHRPYGAPDSLIRRFASPDPSTMAYDASIAYLDRSIRNLLDRMAAVGALDNTIVVVTSDHGELFGEHDLRGHGNSLYAPLLRVPLLIMVPAARSPVRIPDPVSLTDLPSTILDLAGAPPSLPGRSLVAWWQGDRHPTRRPIVGEVRRARNVPDRQPVSAGDVRSAIDGDLQYILNPDGSEELYRIWHDPGETTNLVDSLEWRDRLAELRVAVRDAFGVALPSSIRTGSSP